MHYRVLITGATGVLGKAIVEAAVIANLQAVRNRAKPIHRWKRCVMDDADPSTIPPAIAEVAAIVLMAPPFDPNAPAEPGPVIAEAGLAAAEAGLAPAEWNARVFCNRDITLRA